MNTKHPLGVVNVYLRVLAIFDAGTIDAIVLDMIFICDGHSLFSLSTSEERGYIFRVDFPMKLQVNERVGEAMCISLR